MVLEYGIPPIGVIMLKGVVLGLAALLIVQQSGASTKLSQTVETETDLSSIWEDVATRFQPISPPSLSMYVHSVTIPVPVSWNNFNKKTTKYMYAEMNSRGLPEYKILIHEDVVTRERIITHASTGFELARIPSPKGYMPEAYYLGLLSKGAVYNEFNRWIFDLAHNAVEVTLVPESMYSAYVPEQTLAAQPMAMGEPIAMSSIPEIPDSEGGGTNTGQTVSLTNTLATLTFPVPQDFGSLTGEIFQRTNLVSGSWEVGAEGVAVTAGGSLIWTDMTSSNIQTRFYILNDPSQDLDNDDLNDGKEVYIYDTLPDDKDTDSDGIWDGWEVANGLDPKHGSDAMGDIDQNGIPDFYDFLVDDGSRLYPGQAEGWVYVDTNDAGGIQGAIDEALAGASNGFPVVVVEPGVYTGSSNRNLTITNSLAVLGKPGTVIECEGLDRCFHAVSGDWILIDGFTVTNAYHYGEGAGIHVENTLTNLILKDMAFESCVSPGWGVIGIDDMEGNASILNVRANSCSGSYSVIEAYNYGILSISDSDFHNCDANGYVVSAWDCDEVKIRNLLVDQCSPIDYSILEIGDIVNDVVLEQVIVSGCDSGDSIIYADSCGSVSLTDALLQNSEAGYGLVNLQGCGDVCVSGATAAGCNAFGSSSVFYMGYNGNVSMLDAVVSDCVSGNSLLWVSYNNSLSVSNCVVERCSSYDSFSSTLSLYGQSETVVLNDIRVRDCYADGNILETFSNAELDVRACGINNCESGDSILNSYDSTSLNALDILDCSSYAVLQMGGDYGMTNSVVADCVTDAGIFYTYNATADVAHCTFTGNGSMGTAWGNFSSSTVIRVDNSVLWGNTGETPTNYIGLVDARFDNSCIEGGWTGAGTNSVSVDPYVGGNGRLVWQGSVAIDYCTNSTAAVDLDGEVRDSIPDMGAFEWFDADGDGIGDWWEVEYFGNTTSVSNSTPAPDGDGRLTFLEKIILNLDPYDSDYDDDGVLDYDEDDTFNPSGIGTDPRLPDTDCDGFGDYDEYNHGMNPLEKAVPGSADWEGDADGDGLSNGFELQNLLNPFLRQDSDFDGLWDDRETLLGTDRYDSDTDDDGFLDGAEFYWGYTSPTTNEGFYSVDSDGDGLLGWQELDYLTNPTNGNTDADSSGDGEEVLWGSDPTNAVSFLVSVAGTIVSDGMLDGEFRVYAESASQLRPGVCSNDTFSVTKLPNLETYGVTVYRDTNSNGVHDVWEELGSTNLLLTADTNGVEITMIHPDDDSDGMPDWWEYTVAGGDIDPAGDDDFDGLSNFDEYIGNTNPLNPDSDGDGTSDGLEVASGTSATNSASFPASIRGLVRNDGGQTGTVYVLATDLADDWTLSAYTEPDAEGSYKLAGLSSSTSYYVRAFVDSSGNGQWDAGEHRSDYASNAVTPSRDTAGINILIESDAPGIDTDGDSVDDLMESLLGRDKDAFGIVGDTNNVTQLIVNQPL